MRFLPHLVPPPKLVFLIVLHRNRDVDVLPFLRIGYMAGNGINVIRIAPYSAVQFSTYEFFKGVLITNSSDHSIDTPRRLLAGALAGIAAVVSTYPLDLVRSRLSVESASLGMKEGRRDGKSTGILRMTARVYREEGGFRALYRGLIPT